MVPPVAQTARFGSELRRLYENVESDDAWRDIRLRADIGAAARRLRAAVVEVDDDEAFRPAVVGDDLLVIPGDEVAVVAAPLPGDDVPLVFYVPEVEVHRVCALAVVDPTPTSEGREVPSADRAGADARTVALPEPEHRLAQRHAALVDRLRRHALLAERADDLLTGIRAERTAAWEIRVAPPDPATSM